MLWFERIKIIFHTYIDHNLLSEFNLQRKKAAVSFCVADSGKTLKRNDDIKSIF